MLTLDHLLSGTIVSIGDGAPRKCQFCREHAANYVIRPSNLNGTYRVPVCPFHTEPYANILDGEAWDEYRALHNLPA